MKVKTYFKCGCSDQERYECGGLGAERCIDAYPCNYAKAMLCRARHDGVEDFIFPTRVNPLDTDGLEEEAIRIIKEANIDELRLYVTGLSVALVAVINACRKLNVELVLFHYNSDSGGYFIQTVRP